MFDVSVIITWRDRKELSRALASFMESKDLIMEIIVVNAGGDRKQLESICGNLPISLVVVECGGQFNKSRAINIGVHIAKGLFIFLADADVLVTRQTLGALRSACLNNSFATIDKVLESKRRGKLAALSLRSRRFSITFELADHRTVCVPMNYIRYTDGSRRGCGLILTSKGAFLEVGGMNSTLRGWGWEDVDLAARLQIHGLTHESVGHCTHLSHSDAQRDLRGLTKIESEERNLQRCLRRYESGNFKGTFSSDIARLRMPVVYRYSPV